MSNSLAIGAVTATLRNLLDKGISAEGGGLHTTTLPPEKAQTFGQADGAGRINLFLYQTHINAAWRNMDMPNQIKPNETGQPPLALDLFYLLTAYERDDGDSSVIAHRLLGRAMRVLHDHPLLGADEIRTALPNNDLADQIERIRITPQPMPVEEFSKLWTTFQVGYRISAAYQVSVVLIDSTRAATSPLPVLKRGSQDRGVISVASPSPSVSGVRADVQPPGLRPNAQLGDDLIISGQNFSGEGITVRFTRQPVPPPPAEPETIELVGSAGNENQIKISLTNDAAAMSKWAPGFYNVSLVVALPNVPSWITNETPFALAPTITVAPSNAVAGDVTLTVTSAPRLRDGQRVLLLFGSRQIPVKTISTPADATQPTTLTFLVPAATPGKYVVRLRVDGVDSSPIVSTGTPPALEFDPNQTATIT
jgi:Pvc16 N-terminal domain